MIPKAGNLFFKYGLPILLIMHSCAPGLKTKVHSPSLSHESLTKSSPFYDSITGCYKLKFIEDNSTILADFNNDSTFKFIIPGSTGPEYFNGIWYLSDSLLLLDLIDAGGRDCLTGKVFDAHDTANLILMKWKLNEIKPDSFSCYYKEKKFSKKYRIFAVKSDNCKDFVSK
jgi:hypothetical protein